MLACMQMFHIPLLQVPFLFVPKGIEDDCLYTDWLDAGLFHYLCRIVEDNFPKLLL